MKAELLWARRLCNRRGWPVIDVTRRSIEETAATVLQLMEAWHERRRKDAAAEALMLQRPAPRLILASASASRRALLAGGRPGIRGPSGGYRRGGGQARRPGAKGMDAEDAALRLAELKAAAVARREPEALVIGADQILVCDGVWFDKPDDVDGGARAASRAARPQACAGHCGRVPSRRCARSGITLPARVSSMRAFSDDFLDGYLAAEGEAVTSTVGAYRLEGRGRASVRARSKGEHSRDPRVFPCCRCSAFLRSRCSAMRRLPYEMPVRCGNARPSA